MATDKTRARRTPPRYSESRFPSEAVCRRCGATILVGMYDGFDMRWDTTALNKRGELIALMLGHKTHWLVGENIYRRSATQIRENPEPWFGEVVREHRCKAPPIAPDQTLTRFEPDYSGDPPF